MSDFWRYLRSRLALMLFLMGAAALFTVAFALYHLPLAAAAYPAALTLAAGLCALGVGYRRYARKCRALRKLQEAGENLPSLLPAAKEPLEAEYRALAVRLCARHQAREEEISGQYRERIAYYTLWAHQFKTPIAAMGLTLQNQDTALSRQLMGQLTRISQYADMALAYTAAGFGAHGLCDSFLRSGRGDSGSREEIFRGIYSSGDSSGIQGRKSEGDYRRKVAGIRAGAADLQRPEVYPRRQRRHLSGAGPTLCIADTGIGIAPEDLPRIFENGYTGLNGRRDKRASGIGLYLCRRICQESGP